jgi:hypothetical protein
MLTPKELQLINFAHFLNTHPWLPFLIIPLAIWVIVWKGIALWKSARNNQMAWFVVLLLVNTIGILEIIYIFFLQNKHFTDKSGLIKF